MLQPVINDKCATSGCHAAGDNSPDLSSESRIYNATVTDDDGAEQDVIDTIYRSVILDKSMPMQTTLTKDLKKRCSETGN